jgi:molybdopterin-biosynthesis enzyme MoeA-like protein
LSTASKGVSPARAEEGAEQLVNPRGTAPGQWLVHVGVAVMLLPGPPGELKPLFTAECLPRLEAMLPKQVIRTRFYRVAGMPESDLDALIATGRRLRFWPRRATYRFICGRGAGRLRKGTRCSRRSAGD